MNRYFIRDDDTSFFTKIEELNLAYSDLWEYGPISLALIPYAVETFEQGILGKQYQNKNKESFIGDNKSLVLYLKDLISENKISIMLHGYNHYYKPSNNPLKYPFGIPEFIYRNNQYDYIKKGKEALEETFNLEIKWFIPPSNSLTLETIKACDKLQLNIPMLYNLKNRFVSTLFSNPYNFVTNRLNLISNNNLPLRFNNHIEISCTSYTTATDFNSIYVAHKNNKIIATHYWEILKYPYLKKHILNDLEFYNHKIYSMNDIV